jgi:PAS domain S-box-containing protein
MTNALKTKKELVQELEEALKRLSEAERVKVSPRESEGMFASIFRYSPIGFSLTRLRDGVIIEINDSYTTFTGYTREEIIGRKVDELNIWVNPADRERMLKMMGQGRVINEEFYLRVKSGEIHPVLISAENINVRGEDCLLVMALDITERKQAEKALRESEQKYAGLVEHGNDGILIIQDRVIKYINSKLLDIFGYSYEEVIGKQFINVVAEEHRERVTDRSRKRLAGKKVPEKYEFDIINKKGERVNVEVSASLMEFEGRPADMAIVRDMTERKQAEEELKESEEFTSSLLTHTPNPIFVTYPDSAIKYVNPAFEKLTGFALTEIIGMKRPYPWWPQETRDEIKAKLKEPTLGDGKKKEMAYQKKSGERFRVELNATFIEKAGKPKYTLINWVDITERKQAEEALRDSEEKFSKAFNSASDAMAIILYNRGIFLEVNDGYVKISGYSRDELIGHNADELNMWGNPPDRGRILRKTKEEGRVFQEEVSFRTKSGNIRNCLFSSEPINVGGEQHMITVVQDITERKQTEKALQESEEKFSKAFSSTANAISIISVSDSKFIEINEGYSRFTGYTREEAIGHTAAELNLWVNEEEFKQAQISPENKGNITNVEFHSRMKSGEIRVGLSSTEKINIGGKECRIVAITDITERKKAQEALQESEEFNSTLLTNTPNAIFVTYPDGAIKYVNPAFETLTGFSLAEIIGMKTPYPWWPRDNKDEIEANLMETIPGEGINLGEKLAKQMTFQKKNGELFIVDLNATIINNNGKREYILVTWIDITERKKAEEALQRSEENFRRTLEDSPFGIRIVNSDDETIYANRSLLEMFSYDSIEEFRSIPVQARYTPESYAEYLIRKEKRESGDEAPVPVETSIIRKDGEIRHLETMRKEVLWNGERQYQVIYQDITERKKAEEALQDSEEKFSKAFNSSANAICIVSLADNKFIEVNESFCIFSGYNREEVIGRTAADLNLWVSQDDRKQLHSSIEKEGKFTNFEFHSRMKSGEIRTGLSSAETINIAGNPCRIVVITDITERKKAEEALKDSEDKFSKVFSTSANAICITSLADGKFIEVNDAFYRFTGYTREESVGHGANELNLWVKPEEMAQLSKKLKEDGRAYNIDFHSRMKSGEIRVALASVEIINIGGKPCRILVITDITELKKTEEALQESEEKFSKAFNSSTNAICITTLKDNHFIEINESFTRFTGYTYEEIIGRSASELKLWVKPEELELWMNTLQKDGRVFNQEFSSRNKSGEIRIGLSSAEVINIKGEPCRIVVVTDITERKKAEDALGQALSNLEQSNARLAASNKELEAFSYSVSHDLRSPLRSIDGFSQALLEDYANKIDATGQDYLKRLRSASQKMGELIDGLLRLSRLSRSELHREPIDLSIMAIEIATRLREMQPDRKVEFIIGGDLTANGDPQLLRALLENLLGNAWKFTGKVPSAIIEFGSIRNGLQKTFFVKDNGAGFDMTYVDKLFGVFQRLHDVTEFPGTGIGLATVQRIINRHGGTVRAEGEVGKGATFYFTLG